MNLTIICEILLFSKITQLIKKYILYFFYKYSAWFIAIN